MQISTNIATGPKSNN